MSKDEPNDRYLYWFTEEDFPINRKRLQRVGYRFTAAKLTPCQVLKSRGENLVYAPPSVWSGMCRRQGSWYRESMREGGYMLMSDHQLPAAFDGYLDSKMSASDFAPKLLPTSRQLKDIVRAPEYRHRKPREWEAVAAWDSLLFKAFFTLTRFWGRRDSLSKHWLAHRANHANFLTRRFTTDLDGEQVPYSVTSNAGVCSSCAEFFNVVEPGARKLVRACPGSIVIGGARREVYYDIRPLGTRSNAEPVLEATATV